jgi:hypothetical protein
MRPRRSLFRATFDELETELAHRGYRAVPVAQAAALDRLVPIPPDLIADIHAGLRLIPGLCAEIRELMGRLAVADGAVAVLIANGFDEGLAELLEDQ